MSFVRLAKRGFDQMNEHDVVRVKETVVVTPNFRGQAHRNQSWLARDDYRPRR